MGLELEVNKGTLIIRLPSDLDCNNVKQIREGADKIIDQQSIHNIIFDFRQTRFMDSAGIGVIIGRYRKIRLTGGNVIATHVNEQVERLLVLSGVHRLIPIDREESMESRGIK